jgi:tetratricopeptide (TPR) repeat protein
LEVANILGDLIVADYRVRTRIRENLEINYFRQENQPIAAQIAFQLAFCYRIGFGVKSDGSKCDMWLGKSNRHSDDFKIEKEVVRPTIWKKGRMSRINGLMTVDNIYEYRTWRRNTLQEALAENEREADDMAREFGDLHFIPLGLYRMIGDLLDELGELAKSKALRMLIRDQMQRSDRVRLSYYIASIVDLSQSHNGLSERQAAQELQEVVARYLESIYGVQTPETADIMNNLSSTYNYQGRWKEAEELCLFALKMKTRELGKEHPDTVVCMGNFAAIYTGKGAGRKLRS